MNNKIITFGDIEIEKQISLIQKFKFLEDVDIDNIWYLTKFPQRRKIIVCWLHKTWYWW